MIKQEKIKLKNYVPILNELIQKYDIVTACVWGKIWSYCQLKNGYCRASQSTIAKELNISSRTVMRSIQKLIAGKFLEDTNPDKKNKEGIARHYKVTYDNLSQDSYEKIIIPDNLSSTTDNLSDTYDKKSDTCDNLSPDLCQNVTVDNIDNKLNNKLNNKEDNINNIYNNEKLFGKLPPLPKEKMPKNHADLINAINSFTNEEVIKLVDYYTHKFVINIVDSDGSENHVKAYQRLFQMRNWGLI